MIRMDTPFKDMTLAERIDVAQAQAGRWRAILRQLNRELTAVTPEERAVWRARSIDEVDSAPNAMRNPDADG